MGCHGQIVKAHDAHVLRDADPPVITFRDGGDSPYVMGKENGSDPLGHQLRDVLPGRIVYEIAKADIVFIDFQAVFFHSADVGMISGFLDVGFQRAGDQAYFFMSQAGEMLYCQFEPFLAVAAHGGYVRVPLDIIIV